MRSEICSNFAARSVWGGAFVGVAVHEGGVSGGLSEVERPAGWAGEGVVSMF